MTSPGIWQSEQFRGLPYRLLMPDDVKPGVKYPLVVFLHGSGERDDDNRQQLKWGVHNFNSPIVRRKHPCIVVAPQCPKESSFGGVWFGGPNETQRLVVDLTRELSKTLPVDDTRRHLVGVSMGAIGGWEIAALYPKLYASAVLVCGEPNPDWAELLGELPIWSFHGSADAVVPPANVRAIHERLAATNKRAKYTEFEGEGHNLWDKVFLDIGIYDWLFDPQPA